MPLFDLFGVSRRTARTTAPAAPARDLNNRFSTEFADENPTFNNYASNGIMMDSQGDAIKLRYSGLLSKSGAPEVYAVVGAGGNNQWNNVNYYRMNNNGLGTFEVTLPINNTTSLNVCFKDGANNWDNNSGKNYSFSSH